nr:hypothetical protein [Tanacetum cinerariifolium]
MFEEPYVGRTQKPIVADVSTQEEKKFTTPKEAKDRVYMHSIKSRRNLKLYENDNVRIRASCYGKVLVFSMSQVIPFKHAIAACWNMALNDPATPPSEAWVNPCYWLTTWRETYSHKVGRPTKKRKRSKHEDEPFAIDGKLSRKERTITCQSCGNTGHNKSTCKGQGRKATTGGAGGLGGAGVGRQDGKEMDDVIPTQSSAAGGASE